MRSWDPVWERIFSTRPWGKYPPEELIRFIATNYYRVNDRKSVRILDLGCGPGSNSWYLAREGFSVYGIDGSPTAIDIAEKRLAEEGLSGEFVVGDFIGLPWPDKYFDCVIDVVSIACNGARESMMILSEVFRVLKPGGKIFSITFKPGTWGDCMGEKVEENTYDNITDGPCAGMGITRFSPEAEIIRLYGMFDDLVIDYNSRSIANRQHEVSHWLISGKKPVIGTS